MIPAALHRISVGMYPCLYSKDFQVNDGTIGFPSSSAQTRWAFSGSTALFQIAQKIGFESGEEVLCPAYNCGHEIEPFRKAGAVSRYYRLKENLDIDLDHIATLVNAKTKALLVTHYFGMPQPLEQIRAFCDQRQIILIEDCAHALLSRSSGVYLGTVGDYSAFSLRKTLGIPNGGAAVAKGGDWRDSPATVAAPRFVTYAKALQLWVEGNQVLMGKFGRSLRLVAFNCLGTLLATAGELYKCLRQNNSPAIFDPDDENIHCEAAVYAWEMAPMSRKLVGYVDEKRLVQRRRENFEFVVAQLANLPELKPLYVTLEPGVCPWMAPFRTANPQQVVKALLASGVGTLHLWSQYYEDVPWGDFPFEATLKKEVLALPIHQDLDRSDLERLVQGLKNYYRENSPTRKMDPLQAPTISTSSPRS